MMNDLHKLEIREKTNSMGKYLPTIGLEVHIQLATESKIFCADRNVYGAEPNTNISVISLAHPGTLPKLNKKAIEFAVKMGLACHSRIANRMYFDRKNYFYPDLPKGYQLTQDKTPICSGGYIEITGVDGEKSPIQLTKIHLEEDAGKLIHDPDYGDSNVDFNRAGVPLIELVTEPVLTQPEDASRLLTEIRKIVRFLGISTGDMEKGSLRCDANVSIAPEGANELGSKVEIKNMNSFKHVKQAINHEIHRQTQLLESGEEIISETRLYNVDTGKTYDMRTKEELNDYRYFPEPDLCQYEISQEWLHLIKEEMPPLPSELHRKFVTQYGVSEKDATILTDSKSLADYYLKLCKETNNRKAAANWLIGPVKSHLNEVGGEMSESILSITQMAGLIELVQSNKVSFSKASSEILPKLLRDRKADSLEIAKKLNLIISSNGDDIQPIIQGILEKHPDKVSAYQNGKKGLLGMFMGELMRETKGKVDPKEANRLLAEALEG